MTEQEDYQRLLDYSYKLLSLRPRSNSEIKTRLSVYAAKKKIPQSVIDKAIKELSAQNLINDEDFANWWIDQRQSFRPKGERMISQELKVKGIASEIIQKVINKRINAESELEQAQRIIAKKRITEGQYTIEKTKIKIRDALLRRGFSWHIIYQVIDSYFKKS